MKYFGILLLGIFIFTGMSCEKEEINQEPAYTINDFVGSWKATSFTFTNNSSPAEVMNVIENGAELRFTMLQGGNTRTWFSFGTFNDEWDANIVITDDNIFTSTPAELERGINVFEFVYDNDILTLTNHNDTFDFTLAGEPEVSATSVSVFVRN